MSSVFMTVRLVSGNLAVYEVQPQHVPRPDIPQSKHWPREYGRQIAHELNGKWYRPGGWVEINDPKAVELLEAYATEVV